MRHRLLAQNSTTDIIATPIEHSIHLTREIEIIRSLAETQALLFIIENTKISSYRALL